MATPYDFGAKGDGLTDDSVALNKWAAAGGCELPLGNFILNGLCGFGPGFKITHGAGRILYRRGWTSGYALAPRPDLWTKAPALSGIVMDFSAGGSITLDGESDLPRKGYGLINLDGFTIIKPGYYGRQSIKPGINLFAFETRDVRNGRIIDAHGDNLSGHQGCDWLHFSRNNENLLVSGGNAHAGDDCISVTVETPSWGRCVSSNIRVTGGDYTTDGHSIVKALISTDTKSVIEDFHVSGVKATVRRIGTNPGQPVILQAGKGTIRRVSAAFDELNVG